MVRIRKAAIVLASLPRSEAEALAARLSPAQQAVIFSELARIAPGQSDELRQATRDLLELARSALTTGMGRPDGEPTSLGSEEAANRSWEDVTRLDGHPAFAPLNDRAPCELAALLESERPHVIAVALAHLPRVKATKVLTHFPETTQLDVNRHLAGLEPADPELLEQLARSLCRRWHDRHALVPAGTNS
jgi:flagellar motor switch protein FliG